MAFDYLVAAQWVDDQIAETGREPAREHRLAIDLAEVAEPDIRRRLLRAARAYASLGRKLTLEHPDDDPESLLDAVESWLMLVGRGVGRDRFAEEMQDWIEDFGSIRLRRAAERGYKVNATYARERAARDFPDFWVHTRAEEIWSERTDPSEEALELEQAVLARVAARADDIEVRIVLAHWAAGGP